MKFSTTIIAIASLLMDVKEEIIDASSVLDSQLSVKSKPSPQAFRLCMTAVYLYFMSFSSMLYVSCHVFQLTCNIDRQSQPV